MKAIVQVQTPDRAQNQAQQNIKNSVNELSKNPLNGGVLLSSVVLSSGDNTIEHKLDKNLTGWFIVRQRASAIIYDKQDSNPQKSKTLVLNSSANVTVDLYVF